MQERERRILLVGSHFCPPAKTLLACLSSETPVYFEREPENPYDGEAIKVFCLSEDLDEDLLRDREEELNGHGETSDGVLDAERHWLGHVGASEGKPMLKARLGGLKGLIGTKELGGEAPLPRAFLEFSPDGQFITARLEEDETNV